MSLQAKSLGQNNIQKRALRNTTVEILNRLDEELKIAFHEGKRNIITTLPIIFSIPNMPDKDAQRIIWSNIINSLIKRDFRVWINPIKSTCVLKVTWLSNEDEAETSRQMDLLVKHTKK